MACGSAAKDPRLRGRQHPTWDETVAQSDWLVFFLNSDDGALLECEKSATVQKSERLMRSFTSCSLISLLSSRFERCLYVTNEIL